MTPYRSWSFGHCSLLILLLTAGTWAAKGADTVPTGLPPEDALTREAFDHYYNLDYDPAVADFERVVATHPNDALALNHLISAVLYRELYRIGALDTSLYSNNNNSFISRRRFPFDSKVSARLAQMTTRALQLSETRLQQNPDDVQALYARGLTRGLRAMYQALAEKAYFAALRSAVGARHDHERVLELAPGFVDAKTIVGAHNYVASAIPWMLKPAATLAGLGGNRQKGIQYLYEAANAGGETSVDARVALALFLRREQRFDEALKIVRQLQASHPRNFLFALEEANVLKDGGHGAESIAAYRHTLQAGKDGYYFSPHLEQAAYGQGEALRGQRDYAGAAAAYDSVRSYPARDPELQQKASLAAGEMYDLLEQRELALEKYRAVIAMNVNSSPAEIARKHMKEPYRTP